METFDVAILGLGAMGSAAAYQSAKRGLRVLGLDQFVPPHVQGSSHGESRITRLAIGEGAHYTPLAMRSHAIWREIEKETGDTLYTATGGLMISSPAKTSRLHVDNFFDNTVAAAERFAIQHEILNARDILRRFPQFKIHNDEIGYYEPEAGYLRPEACVGAQLRLARKHGAEIHTGEKLLGFDASPTRVTIRTDKGSYAAGKLILTAGPWLPGLLGAKYASCFRIYRQCLFWFGLKGPATPYLPENFPIFIWEVQGPAQAIYGFPAIDGEHGGVKIATQQYEATTTPETVTREVTPAEMSTMYENFVTPHLPGLDGKCLKALSCLYTVTPDSGFVIDRHPEFERVIVASPCSGHGFKHSAAIGEALAEMTMNGAPHLDLSAFKFGRFVR